MYCIFSTMTIKAYSIIKEQAEGISRNRWVIQYKVYEEHELSPIEVNEDGSIDVSLQREYFGGWDEWE